MFLEDANTSLKNVRMMAGDTGKGISFLEPDRFARKANVIDH